MSGVRLIRTRLLAFHLPNQVPAHCGEDQHADDQQAPECVSAVARFLVGEFCSRFACGAAACLLQLAELGCLQALEFVGAESRGDLGEWLITGLCILPAKTQAIRRCSPARKTRVSGCQDKPSSGLAVAVAFCGRMTHSGSWVSGIGSGWERRDWPSCSIW